MSSVKEGSILSLFLFVLAVDCILCNCTESGIQIGEVKQLASWGSTDKITLMDSYKTRLQDLIGTIFENGG